MSIYASSETEHDVFGQAMKGRNFDLMRFALEHGYDVNYANNNFCIASLYSAVQLKDLELITGADVDRADKFENTPYLIEVGGELTIFYNLREI